MTGARQPGIRHLGHEQSQFRHRAHSRWIDDPRAPWLPWHELQVGLVEHVLQAQHAGKILPPYFHLTILEIAAGPRRRYRRQLASNRIDDLLVRGEGAEIVPVRVGEEVQALIGLGFEEGRPDVHREDTGVPQRPYTWSMRDAGRMRCSDAGTCSG